MTIFAIVENDTIRLPEGTHLPDGTRVTIEAADSLAVDKESGLGGRLKRFVEQSPIAGRPESGPPKLPTFKGGRMLADAGEMKQLLYAGDE